MPTPYFLIGIDDWNGRTDRTTTAVFSTFEDLLKEFASVFNPEYWCHDTNAFKWRTMDDYLTCYKQETLIFQASTDCDAKAWFISNIGLREVYELAAYITEHNKDIIPGEFYASRGSD